MSIMGTSPINNAEKYAASFWEAIETHLSGTTPYGALGLHEGVPDSVVKKAFLAKNTDLIRQPHTPENAREREKLETAYRAIIDTEGSSIYRQWKQDKAYTSHTADIRQLPLKEEAIQRLEAIAEASRELAFKKPVIALGATALAAAGIAYALTATERIRAKKEAGETPERSDRALQALGFAGAAGVISAAVLMWKNGAGHTRS